METKKPPYVVRPPTAILTRGFDPRLSVGSARPAVFRSSTYVFPSPEAAERSFSIALGMTELKEGESADLIYSRLSHPNAEILEDQVVPLDQAVVTAEMYVAFSKKSPCRSLAEGFGKGITEMTTDGRWLAPPSRK